MAAVVVVIFVDSVVYPLDKTLQYCKVRATGSVPSLRGDQTFSGKRRRRSHSSSRRSSSSSCPSRSSSPFWSMSSSFKEDGLLPKEEHIGRALQSSNKANENSVLCLNDLTLSTYATTITVYCTVPQRCRRCACGAQNDLNYVVDVVARYNENSTTRRSDSNRKAKTTRRLQ